MKRFLLFLVLAAQSLAAEWTFDNDSNPASGAVIEVGEFSTGWWGDSFLLTTNTGFWDLGRSGTVSATLAAATTITIETDEWLDGMIYGELSALSIPGYTLASQSVVELEPTPIPFPGAWYSRTAIFTGPLNPQPQLLLVGSVNGTLLNRLHVECTVVQPQKPARIVRSKLRT